MALFQALSPQFGRAKYIEIATQLQIPESTADKQIVRFLNAGLIIKQAHGNYSKTTSNP
jgi:predicted transcriptional regulator